MILICTIVYVMCDILYTASDVSVAELCIVDTDNSENLSVMLFATLGQCLIFFNV